MKTQDLVKLNLDELETELAKGSFSKSFLDSLLKAEKSGKDRSGAIELINDAFELADDEPEQAEAEATPQDTVDQLKEIRGEDFGVIDAHQSLVTSGESYAVAKGQSIGFRAGIKTGGDVVDVEWPEFKANKTLLDSMLERGLVVKQ